MGKAVPGSRRGQAEAPPFCHHLHGMRPIWSRLGFGLPLSWVGPSRSAANRLSGKWSGPGRPAGPSWPRLHAGPQTQPPAASQPRGSGGDQKPTGAFGDPCRGHSPRIKVRQNPNRPRYVCNRFAVSGRGNAWSVSVMASDVTAVLPNRTTPKNVTDNPGPCTSSSLTAHPLPARQGSSEAASRQMPPAQVPDASTWSPPQPLPGLPAAEDGARAPHRARRTRRPCTAPPGSPGRRHGDQTEQPRHRPGGTPAPRPASGRGDTGRPSSRGAHTDRYPAGGHCKATGATCPPPGVVPSRAERTPTSPCRLRQASGREAARGCPEARSRVKAPEPTGRERRPSGRTAPVTRPAASRRRGACALAFC